MNSNDGEFEWATRGTGQFGFSRITVCIVTSETEQVTKIQGLEREYRKAVVGQQTTVENAVKWQADTLPVGNPLPQLQSFDP